MTWTTTLARLFERPHPLADADTFAQLYAATYLNVFRYIYALHGGPQTDVEDLTAATFERAWRARRRFSGDESAALGWLLIIARRLVIDARRRHTTRGGSTSLNTIDLLSAAVGPETMALRHEQTTLLLQALQSLSAEQREMVVLRYVLGWRVRDIAEHIGKQENTVSVAIRRALQTMREHWPNTDVEESQ